MSYSYCDISIRSVTDADMPFLFRLYTDPGRCHLWMSSRRVYEEREFREAWNSWVNGAMGAKFIVERSDGSELKSRSTVGWVMSYDHNLEHGFAKVGTILEDNRAGHGAGLIATALFMDYLFKNLPLRKIYHEVYGFNPCVVRILRKLGLVEEGILKEDRFWDGSYWDLHIFAFFRETWPEMRDRVLRPARRCSYIHKNTDGIKSLPIDHANGLLSTNKQLG